MSWSEKRIKPEGLTAEPRLLTSPSAFEVMRGCMYRSGLERDLLYKRDKFPSPQTVIGNATHKLKEIGSNGGLRGLSQLDRRAAAADLWLKEIERGRNEMVALALGDPPPPEGWPNYQKRRVYAIKDLELSPVVPELANLKFTAEPEVLLKAHDGAISGRVDLVRKTTSGVEIIDYKTGELSDSTEDTTEGPQLKSSYRRQLLLYAYLYDANFGTWPVNVIAQNANGRQSFSFTPDHSEANTVASEALELLGEYNQHAAAGTLPANPSQEACRYCPFKAACPSFFEASTEEWDLSARFSVRGKVASMNPATSLVTLETTKGNAWRTTIHIGRVPGGFFEQTAPGDVVSFAELAGDPGKGLNFLWWSRSWCW